MLKNVIRSLSDRMFLRMFARSLDGKWRIPLRLAKRIVLSVVFIRKNSLVLINGNRFVSVKKKKKKYWRRWREREGRRFFTFVHSYSLRFSPFHKLDRFRVIVQVSPSRLCFNSPSLLALFFTADHCTINPASSVCLCIFHRFRGTVTLLGETPLKF